MASIKKVPRDYNHHNMIQSRVDSSDGESSEGRLRQPGKQPNLRPSLTASKMKGMKLNLQRRSPFHGMKTRSKSRAFRLLELPPELRANIYHNVFTSAVPTKLEDFRLPSLLAVNKEINSEALSVFFDSSEWVIKVRSNWCARADHYHGPRYIRHEQAGQLKTSRRLPDLPQEAVRFRKMRINVLCICCVQGVELGQVRIEVEGAKTAVSIGSVRIGHSLDGMRALEGMVKQVEELVANVEKRNGFNGFTVADLGEVGRCFQIDHSEEEGDLWWM